MASHRRRNTASSRAIGVVVAAGIITLSILSVGQAQGEPAPSTTTVPTPISPTTGPSAPVDDTAVPTPSPTTEIEATLTLSPQRGVAGTPVTITVVGSCLELPRVTAVVEWDGTPVDLAQASTQGGGLMLPYTVPDATPVGDYRVSVSCGYPARGVVTSDAATFTVVAPQRAPTLTVDPATGVRGSRITVSGNDFDCGPPETVELLWDGTPVARDQAPAFTVAITVPDQTPVGPHRVVARCQNDTTISSSQPFDVIDTAPPDATPTLSVQPASGRPGEQMLIAGERFACRSVELSWDDRIRLADLPVDAAGGFAASVPVPADAEARGHTVRAACAGGPVAVADFTVLAGPPPPPPPPPPPATEENWGWVILALILAGTAGVVARQLYRRRPHPGRVHADAHPDLAAIPTLRETPAPGEATHTIRFDVHADRGVQTSREGA